ncbi:hypothetical protein BaRGS_00003410 [Batillaria attramentaria]|uniref:Uncharacterized protein n=1 Tax=Batillaria attramentaria TaxID=370345 RepID=A0ABD0M1R0_9CAEN
MGDGRLRNCSRQPAGPWTRTLASSRTPERFITYPVAVAKGQPACCMEIGSAACWMGKTTCRRSNWTLGRPGGDEHKNILCLH